MNLADLHKPFDPAKISWRVGSTTKDKSKGMALAYIDSRDVMERLDAVCGAENWECRYPHAGAKTVCEIGIFINDKWVVKADGAGDSDVEAEKGALSDAFKRAAVKWGVGRYLYDLDSPWVELEPAGGSYKIAAKEYARLRAVLAGNAPKASAPATPAPTKPAQDADIEEGVRNWTAQRRAEIDEAARIPDLYQWQDQHESALQRLKSKHKSAYDGLMQYYQAKFDILSKKEAAE